MNATLSHRRPSHGRSSDRRAALDGRASAWQIWAVCGLLVVAVGLVFGQTAGHEFINLDDGDFVSQNPHVTPGLTLAGLRWAFTDGAYGEWTPLTSLSHMLDCQLYGLEPAGHHLTSVLIHAASAVLLFLVLVRMTHDVWPSAWVAAVFAIHPLHVSSVAWVAERREVLAGLFFMLTLGAYALYVERPSLARYLAVAGLLMLGLMAKVILVTVPCVLLLLDYWPLGRFCAEAMTHYTEAVRMAPSTSMFHSDLAVALARAHYLDRAIAEFRETVRLEGDAWPNRVNLAKALFVNGEPREAARICREVLERDTQVTPAAALLQAVMAANPELREPAKSDRYESPAP